MRTLEAQVAALRASRALYRRVVQAADEGIWLIDPEGRTTFVNPRMGAILGYPPEEMIGQSMFAYMDAEARETARHNLARRASGIHEVHPFTFRTRDGDEVWCRVTASPVYEGDTYVGALALVEDVTLEHQRREADRLTLELLAAAIHQAPAGIVIADAPEGRIRIANPASRLTRGPTDAPLEDIPGDEHARAWQLEEPDGSRVQTGALPLMRAIEQGAVTRGRPLVMRRDDGEERHIVVDAAPVRDDHGAITAAVGVFLDVTERRQLEQERDDLQRQILHAQRVESVGLLAGGVAHDFNNLLAVILGRAELAAAALPAGHPASDSIEAIVDTTQVAAALAGRLLAYAGRGTVSRARLELSTLLDDLEPLLRAILPDQIRLGLDAPPDLAPILGDPAQLHQVLLNLVINASEAIGDRPGTIGLCLRNHEASPELAARVLPPGLLPPGPCVVAEVRDDGEGMGPDTVDRIFDPYFSRKPQGHGLGLSAVLGILRSHDGGIEVESIPGSGTVFRVYLPALAGDATPETAPPPEPGPGAARVLVVDDEPAVRELFGEALRAFGYAVDTAADGREALDRVLDDPGGWDAVLLDLSMPRVRGDEVLRTLHREGIDLPVVLCSGYAGPEVLDDLGPAAPAAFLQKPFLPTELVRALQGVLTT